MNASGDSYLRNVLKHWACEYRLPDNGRYRLLRTVSRLTTHRRLEQSPTCNVRYRHQTSIAPPDWCHQMFTWSVFYPFKTAW